MTTLVRWISILVAIFSMAESKASSCFDMPDKNGMPGAVVHINGHVVRKIAPQFFGFNLEVFEFENSLWNSREKRVDHVVIEYMKRFPGAAYRYPGGTVSNYFDWRLAIGPEANRSVQKIVDYAPPRIVKFGPTEYLDFLNQVGGSGWYVLNLFGSFMEEKSTLEQAVSASGLAAFMDNARSKGAPTILRWELGNELDRGRFNWSASKYITASKEVLAGVQRNYKSAQFVGMTQDFPSKSHLTPYESYNKSIARMLRNDVHEFAGHLYYDGYPWGPPLPAGMKNLCKNLDDMKVASPENVMWVTEHARTPRGTPDDPAWKGNWPQTADLGAAVSVADMMISAARTSEIKGAFVHSLHGTSGPWPMFHNHSGIIRPSAVYWAMALLRETMLEDVLSSNVTSSNLAGSGVGYDINTVMMSDVSKSRFSLWLVNRGPVEASTRYVVPSLAGKRVSIKSAYLTGNSLENSNYDNSFLVFPNRREFAADFNQNGELFLVVPAYSVYTADLSPSMAP